MKKVLTIFIVISCAGLLFAYVIGGTNLGYGGYPDFSGYRPSAPFSYNNEVSEMEFIIIVTASSVMSILLRNTLRMEITILNEYRRLKTKQLERQTLLLMSLIRGPEG